MPARMFDLASALNWSPRCISCKMSLFIHGNKGVSFTLFLDNGGVSIHRIVENPFPSVELFVNIIKHIEKRPWSIVKVSNKLIVIQVFKNYGENW